MWVMKLFMTGQRLFKRGRDEGRPPAARRPSIGPRSRHDRATDGAIMARSFCYPASRCPGGEHEAGRESCRPLHDTCTTPARSRRIGRSSGRAMSNDSAASARSVRPGATRTARRACASAATTNTSGPSGPRQERSARAPTIKRRPLSRTRPLPGPRGTALIPRIAKEDTLGRRQRTGAGDLLRPARHLRGHPSARHGPAAPGGKSITATEPARVPAWAAA